MVGVERRCKVSRALPRWWSQILRFCGIWTQTARPQQQTQNLRKIRGCQKILGAEDQELRALEARRNRKKKKKRCAEDLREQADRSTASTLVVAPAPCNTMTPVAPGLQLSYAANAIVAAINGAPKHLDLMGSRDRWRCLRDQRRV